MKFLLLSFFLLTLIPTTAVLASEKASDVIQVEKPFARAAIPGRMMSGAFMTFQNNGNIEHMIINAKSSAAKHVELHNHEMIDGMMRMRQMAHFHLKPGQPKVLQPGGLHIMLIGLQETMTEGSEITIDLVFEDGSETQVKVPVKSISAGK